MRALIPLLAFTALASCSAGYRGLDTGYRGLETPHQPIVTANGATVPHCPDWADAAISANEGQASNYGCATSLNLAAMIADPMDLIHGRGDGVSQTETGTRAIKAWREVPPTSKQWQVTTAISTKAGNQ